MNKTTKTTAVKDNPMRSNGPLTREVYKVAVESLVSPLNATWSPVTPGKSSSKTIKETAEGHKARKAAEGTSKSSKTKVVKVLSEEGEGLSGSQVTVSTGSTVINYIDRIVSSGTPMLFPV